MSLGPEISLAQGKLGLLVNRALDEIGAVKMKKVLQL